MRPARGRHRFALGLEYDGSAFSGWQTQSHAPSVQAALNAAISAVADGPVSTAAAGRTDAGVHATGQVVHFDCDVERPERSWLLGINSHLPPEAVVLWVRRVPQDFHARYSARSRSYRYLIVNRPVRLALDGRRAWQVRTPLDVDAMAEAAGSLLGEHDFTSFRAASCQAKSPVRRLDGLRITASRGLVILDIRGTGFLQHMVRNIVGSLERVGTGSQPPGWLAEVLAARDRGRAGPTAPAEGLYLTAVDYPAEFGLPTPGVTPGWVIGVP